MKTSKRLYRSTLTTCFNYCFPLAWQPVDSTRRISVLGGNSRFFGARQVIQFVAIIVASDHGQHFLLHLWDLHRQIRSSRCISQLDFFLSVLLQSRLPRSDRALSCEDFWYAYPLSKNRRSFYGEHSRKCKFSKKKVVIIMHRPNTMHFGCTRKESMTSQSFR